MTTRIFFLPVNAVFASSNDRVHYYSLGSGRSYARKIFNFFFYEGGYKTAD